METAFGIFLVALVVVICAVFFIRTFVKKRKEAENPCANCVYHECNMTHGVCDRLAKDSKDLK